MIAAIRLGTERAARAGCGPEGAGSVAHSTRVEALGQRERTIVARPTTSRPMTSPSLRIGTYARTLTFWSRPIAA
jgi:hypothetical protein